MPNVTPLLFEKTTVPVEASVVPAESATPPVPPVPPTTLAVTVLPTIPKVTVGEFAHEIPSPVA